MRFALLLTAAALAATPASAVFIQARNTNLLANQGYISPFSNPNGSTTNNAGIHEERFNSNGSLTTCKQVQGSSFNYGPGGSSDPINHDQFGGLTVDPGRSINHYLPPGTNAADAAAHPASADLDQSCYAHGPDNAPGLNGTFQPYQVFTTAPGTRYLGFYLGSIDQYNTFTLYGPDQGGNIDNNPIVVPTLGNSASGEFTGLDLINYLNAQSPTSPALALYSSQYIEFFFSANENFDHIDIGSTLPALEYDNMATTTTAVTPTGTFLNPTFAGGTAPGNAVATPEPLAAAMMLSGMGMLAFARRRAR